MSSAEFTEWAAFYSLEPWGFDMENWRFGVIASVIANSVRDRKKRKRPFVPEDFMPSEDKAARRTSEVNQDVLRAKIDAAMKSFGASKRKR